MEEKTGGQYAGLYLVAILFTLFKATHENFVKPKLV